MKLSKYFIWKIMDAPLNIKVRTEQRGTKQQENINYETTKLINSLKILTLKRLETYIISWVTKNLEIIAWVTIDYKNLQ